MQYRLSQLIGGFCLCLTVSLFNAQAHAAIAFDAATQAISASGAMSLTFAHPVAAGSNRILWVGTSDDAGDTVTGITYNGVPMIQAVKEPVPVFGHAIYLHYLIAPDTGVHNVVISRSGSAGRLASVASSYTGAIQTGQPEATARNSHGQTQSTIRASVPTFAQNSWIVAFGFVDNQSVDPPAVGLINRQVAASGFPLGDSGGPKALPGSYVVGWDGTVGNQVQAIVAASFTPARSGCDIQMSKASYINGNQVVAEVLRVSNFDIVPDAVELALWVQGPSIRPVSFANLGADGGLTLPAGFDQDVGPLSIFTVQAAIPRGTYMFNCRIVDPVTKQTIIEDLNAFQIE
jgi:hypothetical protein